VEKIPPMVERKEININVNKEFEKKEQCKAILKYKKDIVDTCKYCCNCWQRLYFSFQIECASKTYANAFINIFKMNAPKSNAYICISCKKRIDNNQPLDMNLWNHICHLY
jgi:hypothetical protein